MSVIVMDPNLYIGTFGMEQICYDMMEVSDVTGAEAVRTLGPPRWKVGMAAGDGMTLEQSALWEVMILQLKRGINCLAVWDPVRVAPQGTMRGAPLLGAAVAAGAETLSLTNAVGTLLAGDWMQIGTGPGTSQLVKVVAPTEADVSEHATVSFEPALRIAFPIGTAITLVRPVFYARSVNKSVKWDYSSGNLLVSGFALDLLETFQ